ncbi:MAG: SDR family oxidoreductase [Planctomycetes bacterium]|nr:SDR family oxidoreductase [Planctomycetota bacterium]NOG53710.1 SDR family oxidoreductase [Planctomycetota bacterium]
MNDQTRTALVTGGSSGIGRCIAQTLARDGYDVCIVYVGAPADGEVVVKEVTAQGRKGLALVADVSDSEAVNAAVAQCESELGTPSILVNSAGIFRDQVSWKMTDEQWHAVIETNLTGAFNCARAVIPAMRESGRGSIVSISSINGLRGKFGQSNYAASKAGLIGLTKSLAREVAKFGITVNAVAPGMIKTPILDAMPADALEESIKEILVGRIGQPEDIAETVAFLCSEKARFITGEVIRVDGGQYI